MPNKLTKKSKTPKSSHWSKKKLVAISLIVVIAVAIFSTMGLAYANSRKYENAWVEMTINDSTGNHTYTPKNSFLNYLGLPMSLARNNVAFYSVTYTLKAVFSISSGTVDSWSTQGTATLAIIPGPAPPIAYVFQNIDISLPAQTSSLTSGTPVTVWTKTITASEIEAAYGSWDPNKSGGYGVALFINNFGGTVNFQYNPIPQTRYATISTSTMGFQYVSPGSFDSISLSWA